MTEKEQRVPILGSIPLLGAFFRSNTTTKAKTNLMVFIRPTILRDNVQATFETNAKYNYIRNQQLATKPENPRLMPLTTRPVLPDMTQPQTMTPGGSPMEPVIDLRIPPATVPAP